jgi:hypothetical protein
MEFIGLFIAGVLFFAVSAVVGCMYGAVAWLILGPANSRRKFLWAVTAACLPPVFAAYVTACAVVFAMLIPGEGDRTFFGDLYEPLPNGYFVTAMAKMPDDGCISADNSGSVRCVIGWVGSLAVESPFVFGAYSEKEFSHKEGYFALDTRNGTNLDFATLAELDRHAGHPVHLTETFSYRSSDGKRGRVQAIERSIWFGPPLMCSVLYFAFLVKLRRRNDDAR